jgi:NAD(P)-dependent dehydrogenase (short-subunit alcohol dehydrogenase family)
VTPRISITGSADGLGRATAQTLLDDGHEVVVHARSEARLAAVSELVDRGAVPVVGDLAHPLRGKDAGAYHPACPLTVIA